MARNPDSLATYAILESYVKMIATKCSQTYSKKVDTIKKIECGQAIPTGSESTTQVMCLICTYDDNSTINIDVSPITSGMSDVVSKSDLENALKDYTKTVNLNELFSKYTTTEDLTKDFLKKVDAYSPSNKDTLNLFTQDDDGNLLFNGEAISGTSGSITLDDALSETSENGVKNKVITAEFKKYTKTDDLKTALKDDLHTHSNKTVLDSLSDDNGNLKYGTNVLLTQTVVGGLISETDADKKYVAKSNIETDPLDLSTL